MIWRRKACTIFCTNRCEFWRIMSPESLDFTALRIALHREKNRMVMLAVDIKALSCGALRDGYALSSASCTNSVPVLTLVCSFSSSLQSEAELSHLA